ncbi:MAG TPA: PP2C family serine/threonine-protein phosphatase [Jatrophihabitantaceae bacterium]|jgi:protein phosphatase
MALILRYAVRSDLGLVRGNNEDSVYAGPRLLAIADGMGGHAAGEVASKIVIGTLEPLDDDRSPGDLIASLRQAVLEANHRIADAVEEDKNLDGMGTTLTALRFAGSQVGLVHVGDSRAYLLRGDVLSQITHDDTYVQYLVDSGKLTPDEAKDHPRKSVILRALRGAEVEPDVSIREARAGDRYLLCSDGLSDVVSTETIFETLRIDDVQECADRLVELALRGGGPDNVTVIVADVINARPGDIIDDVPVMDGAFVDPSAAAVPGADSAAERAAAIARPAPTRPTADTDAPKQRGRWKTPALILGILVLIAAALGGTYIWAQTQYYVGTAGSEVAIYQGVNASFGPLKFSEVYQNTDLKVDDLNSAWQAQVESGITAKDKGDAQQIVHRLLNERKPPCPPTPAPTTSTSASPSTTPTTQSPSASSSHKSSPAPHKSTPAHKPTSKATHRATHRSTAHKSTAHNAPARHSSSKPRSGSSAATRTRSAPSSAAASTSPSPSPSIITPSGSLGASPLKPPNCRND